MLEKKIQYEFKNKSLLEEACCHSSFINEQYNKYNKSGMRDNERLEFLGDAVLNLIIGHILMRSFPECPEGDLSRMRAGMVNESRLAAVARDIDLGEYVRLGKGESQTSGREKNSILADALEAVIAAIYLDGGIEPAFNFIENHFADTLEAIPTPVGDDYKSQLQEITQEVYKTAPVYSVIREEGPAHDRVFVVQITVCGLCVEARGKSKKIAEQDAARKVIKMLSP